MAEELERRWDDEVEGAWATFRRELGDRLAGLAQDAVLSVEVHRGTGDDPAADGAAPYCQAVAWGRHVLTVEAVGNAFLAVGDRLGPAEEARLVDLGFEPPTGEEAPNFAVTLEQREADRAAWMIVVAMREVHGVVHPAFLTAPPAEAEGTEETAAEAAPDEGWPADDHGPWFPADREQVRAAVHRVARDLVDGEPTWDEDGDLALATDAAMVWAVLAQGRPRVLLTATLLTSVVDEQRALVEVNLLNRRHFGLTFLLERDRVVVRRELPVSAFVPHEVRTELERLLGSVDRWVADLRERVGGRGWHDERAVAPQHLRSSAPAEAHVDEDDDRRYRAAYQVMLELEREERGSVDPTLLVRVFAGDRGHLMRAIGATRDREGSWRRRLARYEEDGATTGVKAARARIRYHRELRSRLRRALRITVQAGRRPEVPEQLSLFAEEDASG